MLVAFGVVGWYAGKGVSFLVIGIAALIRLKNLGIVMALSLIWFSLFTSLTNVVRRCVFAELDLTKKGM